MSPSLLRDTGTMSVMLVPLVPVGLMLLDAWTPLSLDAWMDACPRSDWTRYLELSLLPHPRQRRSWPRFAWTSLACTLCTLAVCHIRVTHSRARCLRRRLWESGAHQLGPTVLMKSLPAPVAMVHRTPQGRKPCGSRCKPVG
jgi:hypothetical protein